MQSQCRISIVEDDKEFFPNWEDALYSHTCWQSKTIMLPLCGCVYWMNVVEQLPDKQLEALGFASDFGPFNHLVFELCPSSYTKRLDNDCWCLHTLANATSVIRRQPK
jgi:hypothetical protein